MAKGKKYEANRKAIDAGAVLAASHPLIAPLPGLLPRFDGPALSLPAGAWVQVEGERATGWVPNFYRHAPGGTVWPNLRRRADPAEWAYVFARLRLHLALGHLDPERNGIADHQAAWLTAERIIAGAGVGRRPADLPPLPDGLPSDEDALRRRFAEADPPGDVLALSLGMLGARFWTVGDVGAIPEALARHRMAGLASGLRAAAAAALDVAGGRRTTLSDKPDAKSAARQARDWVLSEFPLLAALAASFDLVEDAEVCERMGVPIAAICDATREIYINPRAGLTDGDEMRFIMAHEILHAGLRHIPRRQGRDPWLWNVACDYVINGWLIEMRVGAPPDRLGYLHDPALAGMSAEEVYDRITGDLRLMRKLKKARTLNGNAPDMIEGDRAPGWWQAGGADLDAFYRRALCEGLELHRAQGRGLLPAGLVEEIRALEQPPIPWDVALGQWLDAYFPPIERRRSYARANRRQSSTPDIPRPALIAPEEQRAGRVFGALVDTSGSMGRAVLGKALGALASYALSREVTAIRLIQCDAAPHDSGYVDPEALLDRVSVHGRGGTVLMPGLRLLEAAKDFPNDAPVLIVTDGGCDRLTPRGEHAFLMPPGTSLPFKPRGPVFRMG